jgi:hypothetical protein
VTECATWYSSFSLTQAELPPLNWKILQKKRSAVAEIYCLDSIIVCGDYISLSLSLRKLKPHSVCNIVPQFFGLICLSSSKCLMRHSITTLTAILIQSMHPEQQLPPSTIHQTDHLLE